MSSTAAIPLITIYPLLAGDRPRNEQRRNQHAVQFCTWRDWHWPGRPNVLSLRIEHWMVPTSVSGGTITIRLLCLPILRWLHSLPGPLLNRAEPNGNYVIFGLGSYNSMVGKNMVNAPVHFSDESLKLLPTFTLASGWFSRLASPRVGGTYTSLSQATLAGVLDISRDSGLAGINAHIQEFYQAQQAGQ